MANTLMVSMVNHIQTRVGNPPRESDIMRVGITHSSYTTRGDTTEFRQNQLHALQQAA